MTDLAIRAHNHNYHFDPIVRSLLDTDFYKFLMLQFIHRWNPHVPVTFGLINRTKTVKLAKIIPETKLREQLDHVLGLTFTRQELIWLQGNTFYGKVGMFSATFIEFLRGFRLPEYHLEVKDDQYVLTFSGPWELVTLWEIYALTIVAELRTRESFKDLSKFELDILFARAKNKLWDKFQALKTAGVTGISDFGTRRRLSFLYQEWAVNAAADVLGKSFLGTSNTYLAMKHGYEAIGTNAHEQPTVYATLANTPEELIDSQYKVLSQWEKTYDGNLRMALGDTFGTSQFLSRAPEFVWYWRGYRVDSKDPFIAGEELIAWWQSHGIDPREKLIIFSDGLDVAEIIKLFEHFRGRVQIGFGWGTLLTNDFRGCHPRNLDTLNPISLVCKVLYANGKSAVKLSDNYTKATGETKMVEYYRSVFGTEGVANLPVTV